MPLCSLCGGKLISYYTKGGVWSEKTQDFELTDDKEQFACPKCDVPE